MSSSDSDSEGFLVIRRSKGRKRKKRRILSDDEDEREDETSLLVTSQTQQTTADIMANPFLHDAMNASKGSQDKPQTERAEEKSDSDLLSHEDESDERDENESYELEERDEIVISDRDNDSDSSEDEALVLVPHDPVELKRQELLTRPLGKLSGPKRLAVLKTLFTVGSKVNATVDCSVLGDQVFTVIRLSSTSVCLEGKAFVKNPRKGDKKRKKTTTHQLQVVKYRIDWGRLDSFFRKGRWSVQRARGGEEIELAKPVPTPRWTPVDFFTASVFQFLAVSSPSTLRDKARQDIRAASKLSANFSSLSSANLSQLYHLYDRFFFNDCLAQSIKTCSKGPMRGVHFEISGGNMTSTGGLCLDRRKLAPMDILIKISKPVLLRLSFPGRVRANGVECTDRLAALLVLFEHELTHAILMSLCPEPDWELNGGHTHAFCWFVEVLFGHTSYKHELLIQGDVRRHDEKTRNLAEQARALKRQLKVGQIIYVVHDPQHKSQLLWWNKDRSRLPEGSWIGESYLIIKKNPKRVVIHHCTSESALSAVKKLSMDVLLNRRHDGQRFTVPYVYLVSKHAD
eukprot:gb/GEZN01005693.1/.p1 GENE.gb/GEZN01005693.1/~~gb/GEZN01005693.1/.p1  ORF type:complete len:578 (-),score=64.65 gb/GEZN01005693.1/:34-1746(-)